LSKYFRKLKIEQWIGLLFVLILHGLLLYGLISYRMIPPPEEAVALMVELINPPAADQAKPPVIEPVKPPPKALRDEPSLPQQLVAETAVVLPADPVAPPPLPVPAQAPVIAAPVLSPQPVVLSGELSGHCPDRTPTDYPSFSRKLNEQGRVVLRVELDAEGKITSIVIKSRSGFTRLDEAAVAAVKTWRCKPEIRDGVAVRGFILQPFDFKLEEH
jgi:protein TonB